MKRKAVNLVSMILFFCGTSQATTMREFFAEHGAKCNVISKSNFSAPGEMTVSLQRLECESSKRKLNKVLICSPEKSDDAVTCEEDESVGFFGRTSIEGAGKTVSCTYADSFAGGVVIGSEGFCGASLKCAGKAEYVSACKASSVEKNTAGKITKITCGNADFCSKNPLPKKDPREGNFIVSKDRKMLTTPQSTGVNHPRKPNAL
jgi:hypothetical protein